MKINFLCIEWVFKGAGAGRKLRQRTGPAGPLFMAPRALSLGGDLSFYPPVHGAGDCPPADSKRHMRFQVTVFCNPKQHHPLRTINTRFLS